MNTNTLTLSIFTLGFILCLQAATNNSRTQSDFLTLKDRLAGEAETPDEREEGLSEKRWRTSYPAAITPTIPALFSQGSSHLYDPTT